MRVTTLLIIVAIVGGGIFYAWKQGYIGAAKENVQKSFDTHFAAGQGLYHGEDYEAAIKELEAAISLEPGHVLVPDALMRIGDCHKTQKRFAKALEYYQRVVKEYPNFKNRGQVEKSIEQVKSAANL